MVGCGGRSARGGGGPDAGGNGFALDVQHVPRHSIYRLRARQAPHPRQRRPLSTEQPHSLTAPIPSKMSSEKDITLREATNTTPRTKPPPTSPKIPVPFVYNASDDGTDTNLLILLHGLGKY